jgi:hypothetical protein
LLPTRRDPVDRFGDRAHQLARLISGKSRFYGRPPIMIAAARITPTATTIMPPSRPRGYRVHRPCRGRKGTKS